MPTVVSCTGGVVVVAAVVVVVGWPCSMKLVQKSLPVVLRYIKLLTQTGTPSLLSLVKPKLYWIE